MLNCTRREIFYAKFKTVDGQPILKSPIFLTNLEKFIETTRDTPVLLYRVNPERRNPEPLFDLLKKIKLDLPIPDAMLLDSIGAAKILKSSFNPKSPVNPLYIKREL